MPSRTKPVVTIARVISAFAFFLLVTIPGAAQIDTGAIVGTVRDSSGGAIPKAVVALTNAATGLKQSAIANDAGEYQFIALPPGTYSVKATATGFTPHAPNHIALHLHPPPSLHY